MNTRRYQNAKDHTIQSTETSKMICTQSQPKDHENDPQTFISSFMSVKPVLGNCTKCILGNLSGSSSLWDR